MAHVECFQVCTCVRACLNSQRVAIVTLHACAVETSSSPMRLHLLMHTFLKLESSCTILQTMVDTRDLKSLVLITRMGLSPVLGNFIAS